MIMRFGLPLLLLAVLFLPLPFVLSFCTLSALLAVRPRGEPYPGPAVISRIVGPTLLRSPPR